MLRFLDSGESHGKCLAAIIEGFPSNVPISQEKINNLLHQRQSGYGRGERMNIEQDKVEILSGIRHGTTLGSPICLMIENKDWENNKEMMDIVKSSSNPITAPRPGHGDLAGAEKYNHFDIRNIFERASARETAIRTAVGSIAQQFLELFGLKILGHVVQIGRFKAKKKPKMNKELIATIEQSELRCCDEKAEEKMIQLINEVKDKGDTLGGIIEVIAKNVPVGLGSCMHWDRRLDASLAFGLMSMQGIKGVEFGRGFGYTRCLGSEAHDEIFYDKKFYRRTNNCGGIEGGMSNGEDIIVNVVMKPIPTLMKPLGSVDIITKKNVKADTIRSDVCAVPAASVVAQSIVSWELALQFLEKFGGDSLREVNSNFKAYKKSQL